ncbi:sulfatase-like hydrolase/transferase [Aquimarina agarilytica]|uniref:sulfatase-like hydrolase/transferase n=1 Tax=Aquimarina agarilytica TaxID=1087449 RepID=UPI000289873D|nr:sulfatase-like hydrolase/transferase [Aquimarina agarilytica]
MKSIFYTISVLFYILLFSNCSSDDTSPTGINQPQNTPVEQPNILLIIADDMGLDATPGYPIGTTKPNMKTLQNLITNGITFTNVWSNPTCTPTRSGILTGKYGFKTGVIKVGDQLPVSEVSIQKYIDQNTNATYSSAVVGKWHLSNDPSHPNQMGIDYYSGGLSGSLSSYIDWCLTTNGTTDNNTAYTTSKYTDLAINWISNQTQPWFLWLAHNAPHTPFHVPPNNLHSQGNLTDDQASIDANPLPYYMASLEAMDTEIGRLLASMPSQTRNNTIIIFVGDNGTPSQVVQEYNSQRAKGSLFQGGINVPMIISGANVTRKNETENALINTTDLFATIATIAGANTPQINNSFSFQNLLSNSESTTRNYIYSETTTDKTIRNTSHKYIQFADGSEALYDLSTNPLEKPNLLSPNQLPLNETNSKIKDELITALNNIINN